MPSGIYIRTKSVWNEGKKMPQISGINHPMYGKHFSTETKKKQLIEFLNIQIDYAR